MCVCVHSAPFSLKYGCVPRLRVAQLLHAREGEQGGDGDPTGVIQKLLDHEAIRSGGHASQVPLHLRAHEGKEARGGACGGAHEGGGAKGGGRGQEEGQAGVVREGAAVSESRLIWPHNIPRIGRQHGNRSDAPTAHK